MGRAARINAAKREKIKDMHDDSVRLSLILPDGFIDDLPVMVGVKDQNSRGNYMESVQLILNKKRTSATGREIRETCTVEYHVSPENGFKHTKQELTELKRNGYNTRKRISLKELQERLAEGGYEIIGDYETHTHYWKKN